MMRTVFTFAIILSLFTAVLLPKPKVGAEGWHTDNLINLDETIVGTLEEDSFYNYDFDSQLDSSDNVDWPVNLVFTWWADTEFVEDELWGHAGWPDHYCWNYCNDGDYYEWHADQGTKNGTFGHMRPYAPYDGNYNIFWNSTWFGYCVGTSHVDHPPTIGWSENTEEYICDILDDNYYCFVWQDYYNFQNPEDRTEYRFPLWHKWQSNGWASEIAFIIF